MSVYYSAWYNDTHECRKCCILGLLREFRGLSASELLYGPGDPAMTDQTLDYVPVALTRYCSHSPWSTTIWRIFLPLMHSWWLCPCLPLSLPADTLRALLNFLEPVSILVIWNLNSEHERFRLSESSYVGLTMSRLETETLGFTQLTALSKHRLHGC